MIISYLLRNAFVPLRKIEKEDFFTYIAVLGQQECLRLNTDISSSSHTSGRSCSSCGGCGGSD